MSLWLQEKYKQKPLPFTHLAASDHGLPCNLGTHLHSFKYFENPLAPALLLKQFAEETWNSNQMVFLFHFKYANLNFKNV